MKNDFADIFVVVLYYIEPICNATHLVLKILGEIFFTNSTHALLIQLWILISRVVEWSSHTAYLRLKHHDCIYSHFGRIRLFRDYFVRLGIIIIANRHSSLNTNNIVEILILNENYFASLWNTRFSSLLFKNNIC